MVESAQSRISALMDTLIEELGKTSPVEQRQVLKIVVHREFSDDTLAELLGIVTELCGWEAAKANQNELKKLVSEGKTPPSKDTVLTVLATTFQLACAPPFPGLARSR